jgi:hypothetical protein
MFPKGGIGFADSDEEGVPLISFRNIQNNTSTLNFE